MNKPRWALRNWVEYLLFRVARAITALFSPTALAWIGGRFGDLFFLVGGRRRTIIDFNLRLAFPEKTGSERRALAREVSRHFGRSALDAVKIQRLQPDQLLERVEVVGWEHVECATALGRGVFFLTAHMGSWEVAALVTGLRIDNGLAVVNRPLDNPLLEVELGRLRRLYGNHVFGKRGIAREIIQQLRKGGGVGILIDQRVEADVGVAVPFFGHPAWTHPILARMVRRTRAPVVPIFALRTAPGRYRLRYEKPVVVDHLPEAELEDEPLTARFMAILEAAIRGRPEQWLWYHDRWRHLRLGEHQDQE
ncbi:MAG: lysophospholipid acyltransferase family protein [Thermoanaerobaculales bacterium]